MYVMRKWSRSAHGDGAEAAQMLRFDAVHPEMDGDRLPVAEKRGIDRSAVRGGNELRADSPFRASSAGREADGGEAANSIRISASGETAPLPRSSRKHGRFRRCASRCASPISIASRLFSAGKFSG